MKTAITYGTFDLFHVGHVRLLRRISQMCDRLVVACSTDEFNLGKGKESVIPYADRVEILEACRYVDLVIPEESWEQKRADIERYEVDAFVIGADWVGKFDDLSDVVEVYYLPRTEGVSTTELQQVVQKIQEERILEVHGAVEHLSELVRKLL